jgi:hypothetical protein
MATLDDVNSNLLSLVNNVGQVLKAIQTIFPQQTGTSTTATTGPTITLPTHPVGYLVVNLPNGNIVKVPYYAE